MIVSKSFAWRLPSSTRSNLISKVRNRAREPRIKANEFLDDNVSFTDEDTRKAQSDLLEARAKYVLRNNVVEAVMMANPILKAVHNGTNTSPIERYVLRSDPAGTQLTKQQ